MQESRSKTRLGAALAAAALLAPAAPAPAQTLWITDDVTDRLYRVRPDGSPVAWIPLPQGADASVDLDRRTDTFWGTNDSARRGRWVNYDRRGQAPPRCGACAAAIPAAAVGATSPEGLGVDPLDGTLWTVDDPPDQPPYPQVYHLRRDGSVIASFPTATFDLEAKSPQDIAVDPVDGTLWVTDNNADRIYHLSREGRRIGSIPVLSYTRSFDPQVRDPGPQGIAVDPRNRSLWVTDRATRRIYNVTSGADGRPAGFVIHSFSSASYDPASLNPTGIAYDPSP